MYYVIALTTALFLASCSIKTTTETADGKSSEACIAGFVEDTPGAGTLDIYFPSGFSPDVQSIKDVSIEVAQDITEELGAC